MADTPLPSDPIRQKLGRDPEEIGKDTYTLSVRATSPPQLVCANALPPQLFGAKTSNAPKTSMDVQRTTIELSATLLANNQERRAGGISLGELNQNLSGRFSGS